MEKRDLNIEDLKEVMHEKVVGVALTALSSKMPMYETVTWCDMKVQADGEKWLAAYCPVWLLPYKDKDDVQRYFAVNGRTAKVFGQVPLSRTRSQLRVWGVGVLIAFLCGVLGTWAELNGHRVDMESIFGLFIGAIWKGLLAMPFVAVVCLVVLRGLKLRYNAVLDSFAYTKSTKHTIYNIEEEDSYFDCQ